jgi:NitT/TauT family transport system ATP-binding protein
LIRTLAVDPEILLLDEPFSALDFQTRLTVSREVRNIIANERKTSILVTHDISEGISMADRVVVLSKRPARVKASYQIEFAAAGLDPLARREAPEFQRYFNHIWKELEVS